MRLSMANKALAVILLSGIAFASCKKDKSGPNNPGNPGGQTKKISRIEENGQTSATFEYNADGTLKKVTSAFDNGITTAFTLTYNAQKKVSEVASDNGYKSKYVYQNNVLTLTENYVDGDKVAENSFVWENGRMKSNTLFTAFPQDGGVIQYLPTFRSVYSYYANGNVQKISNYVLNQLTDQLELAGEYVYMQYDNKKSPLSVLTDFSQVLMYQPVHINNPLTEKMLDKTGAIEETTENIYTYDAAGYPTTLRSTVTPTGQTPTVINTKFFY